MRANKILNQLIGLMQACIVGGRRGAVDWGMLYLDKSRDVQPFKSPYQTQYQVKHIIELMERLRLIGSQQYFLITSSSMKKRY